MHLRAGKLQYTGQAGRQASPLAPDRLPLGIPESFAWSYREGNAPGDDPACCMRRSSRASNPVAQPGLRMQPAVSCTTSRDVFPGRRPLPRLVGGSGPPLPVHKARFIRMVHQYGIQRPCRSPEVCHGQGRRGVPGTEPVTREAGADAAGSRGSLIRAMERSTMVGHGTD